MPSPYQYREFGIFRLLLAICVLVQHAIVNAAPAGRLRAVLAPCEIGSMAVLVFFCLSGFVITEAAKNVYAARPVAYLTNRLLRNLPLFLVVAALVAIFLHALFFWLGSLRSFDREHPELIPAECSMCQNLAANRVLLSRPVLSRLMNFQFVGIIWAVRVEMVFYIVVFLYLLLPVRFLFVLFLSLLYRCFWHASAFATHWVLLFLSLWRSPSNWRRHRAALVACASWHDHLYWARPGGSGPPGMFAL